VMRAGPTGNLNINQQLAAGQLVTGLMAQVVGPGGLETGRKPWLPNINVLTSPD
jgi:hypothetical protein